MIPSDDDLGLSESEIFLQGWLAFAWWAHGISDPEELAAAECMAAEAYLRWRATELEP
jgi:hypothetical protein